ncbi:MAG: hypothetical protein E6I08_04775 [Chloroflexi bacterium]|nr:MAG: hypothetical protein E6I08_04775 [Chloroflexota bacterium]
MRASLEVNQDPVRWGYREVDFGEHLLGVVGFPVCQAKVEHSAHGYARLLGWVQTVWTDGVGEFDPWAPLDGLDVPFCWIGFSPELFDTPWRVDRSRDLVWEAHSWLCGPPGSLIKREVRMLCGFRWGYRLRSGEVEVWGPEALERATWDRDLPILRAACPSWTFA